ncbi:DedA family protein [Deinococcus misasensis]|uniref:DedA family protein n=1 Tax=Deinococcus misasensis TaxID=392413 RepID=UPI00068D3A99|nr:DedA family protein [Deinococcus misasensis]
MQLPDWLLNLEPLLVHVLLFVVLLIEGIGVPGIPFELLWVTEGLLIHAGKTTFWEAVLWGTLGNWIGNVLGYLFGHKIAAYLPEKARNAVQLEDVKRWYDKNDFWVIVISRWLGFLRTPFILYAGLAGVGFRRFSVFSLIGAALWVGVWQYGLWKSGEAFLKWWQQYQIWIIAGCVLIALISVGWMLLRKPQLQKQK